MSTFRSMFDRGEATRFRGGRFVVRAESRVWSYAWERFSREVFYVSQTERRLGERVTDRLAAAAGSDDLMDVGPSGGTSRSRPRVAAGPRVPASGWAGERQARPWIIESTPPDVQIIESVTRRVIKVHLSFARLVAGAGVEGVSDD